MRSNNNKKKIKEERQVRTAPRLPWRDILSNLSKVSLSLNFRTSSDLSNLPGPSPPFYRWRNSSSRGLFQGHTASEKQSRVQLRSFPSHHTVAQGTAAHDRPCCSGDPWEPGDTSDYTI